jgi:hypothetical protein
MDLQRLSEGLLGIARHCRVTDQNPEVLRHMGLGDLERRPE